MAGGLIALFDDVATLARLAAASLDDVGAAAGKASVKAAGVVVDDTAVTPRYVTGFHPERELPIIRRIAVGSLRNKLLFILPAALVLSQFASWALSPLLMLGGAYLCFEGAEKVWEAIQHRRGGAAHHAPAAEPEPDAEAAAAIGTPEHEQQMVSGAIRTDFILSAEIMVISLYEVASQPLLLRAGILVIVALIITALVYGVVGVIVKMDDVGLHLAGRDASGVRRLGRGLVVGMPMLLSALQTIGTAAMLWVGGHIIIDGLRRMGFTAPNDALHHLAAAAGAPLGAAGSVAEWLVGTLGSGLLGLALGAVLVVAMHRVHAARH